MVKINNNSKVRSASEMKQISRGKETDQKMCLKDKLFLFKIKILDCIRVCQMNHLIIEIVHFKINIFPTLTKKLIQLILQLNQGGWLIAFANSFLVLY